MAKVINIAESFNKFHDTFSPKVVGELNGQLVMLVRCEGDKVPWHTHQDEDEMFFVLEGELEVLEKNEKEPTRLRSGEFCIVGRGVEHRVIPHGHVRLMLFEPAGIAHTGSVDSEITRKQFDRLNE